MPDVAQPSTDAAPGRSLVEVGVLVVLAGLAVAALGGVLAVLASDERAVGFGVGLGLAVLVFVSGATIVCALACLARARLELLALPAIGAACLALDLVVLAAWLDIEGSAYAKTAGTAYAWSLFALPVLGLALAVPSPKRLALALCSGAVAAAVGCALVTTALIVRGGDEDVVDAVPQVGGLPIGDDALLQLLGVLLVVLAACWVGALAAARLPDQRLKRTLTTSPSSTT